MRAGARLATHDAIPRRSGDRQSMQVPKRARCCSAEASGMRRVCCAWTVSLRHAHASIPCLLPPAPAHDASQASEIRDPPGPVGVADDRRRPSATVASSAGHARGSLAGGSRAPLLVHPLPENSALPRPRAPLCSPRVYFWLWLALARCGSLVEASRRDLDR